MFLFLSCHKILKVLFAPDLSALSVDLRKIRVEDYNTVVSQVNSVLSSPSGCPNLSTLSICGGTIYSDDLVGLTERLCELLEENAAGLRSLHLPVCSNIALRSISDIAGLKVLRADRTQHFNKRGLRHLCHHRSKTRHCLESLRLGVFKHRNFNKLDAYKFFKGMRALKSFSLMEEDRSLIKVGSLHRRNVGDKVIAYSVLKLAIAGAEADDKKFVSTLRELKVVDRQLKPKYLLQACPELTRLAIDWQEELSFPPFNQFESHWFSDMINTVDWKQLSANLQELEVVFPSTHSPNTYSLPLTDFSRLMSSLSNVTRLKLVGAGKVSPIPLVEILRHCRSLCKLSLDQTCVHVPTNYEIVDANAVNRNVVSFNFTGDMSSLLVNGFLTCGIAHYLPGLVELALQPHSSLGFSGLSPGQMRELTALRCLEKLSLPLSIRECVMNMPEVIYVLRDFECLRHLVLSWCRWCNSYDITQAKVKRLMQWLFYALGAENANIHLQLSYIMHPSLFTNPT